MPLSEALVLGPQQAASPGRIPVFHSSPGPRPPRAQRPAQIGPGRRGLLGEFYSFSAGNRSLMGWLAVCLAARLDAQ